MAKDVRVERNLYLITTEGKSIEVSYKIDENDDDYILESFRNALENNTMYFEDWVDCDMKFGGHVITELDFKKIIGLNW